MLDDAEQLQFFRSTPLASVFAKITELAHIKQLTEARQRTLDTPAARAIVRTYEQVHQARNAWDASVAALRQQLDSLDPETRQACQDLMQVKLGTSTPGAMPTQRPGTHDATPTPARMLDAHHSDAHLSLYSGYLRTLIDSVKRVLAVRSQLLYSQRRTRTLRRTARLRRASRPLSPSKLAPREQA